MFSKIGTCCKELVKISKKKLVKKYSPKIGKNSNTTQQQQKIAKTLGKIGKNRKS